MPNESKSTKPQPKVGWYYERDGTVVGPVTDARLRYAAKYGHIKPDTLIWRDDFEQWIEAEKLPLTAAVWNRLPSSPGIEPTSTAIRPILVPTESSAPPPEEIVAPVQLESQVTAAEDDTVVDEPLRDAVTDEEAVEPAIDLQMARAIVQRTSGRPLEPSIPPSSITDRPPASPWPLGESTRALALRFIRSPLRLGIGAACLLMVVAALVLLLRPRTRTHQVVGVSPEGAPAVQHASAGASPIQAESPQFQPMQQSAPMDLPAGSTAANTATPETATQSPSVDRLVAVQGPLDSTLFLQHLRHSSLTFDEQCWMVYRVPGVKAERNPSVNIELDIDRAGRVYDATSGVAPKGYRGVGRCIAGRMRGWKFPAASSGTHAVVTVRRGRN